MDYPTPTAKCTLCTLHTGPHTVCMSASKPNPKRDVLLVLDYPTLHEDVSGKPNQGAIGVAFANILAETNLRDSVQITYVVKCRPPGEAQPTTDQVRTCLPYLRGEIARHQPRVIVALGALPIKVFADPELKSRTGVKIAEYRNRATFSTTYTHNGKARTVPVIATYSPKYCQSQPAHWKDLVDDLLQVEQAEAQTLQPVTWGIVTACGRISAPVALDLETTGINPFAPTAEILTAAYSLKRHRASVTTAIDSLIRALDTPQIIGSNLKFDLLWLRKHVSTRPPVVQRQFFEWFQSVQIVDTQVLAHLADENMPSKGLKYLASIHTAYGPYDEAVKGARSSAQMGAVPFDTLARYNAYDAAASFAVAQALQPIVAKEGGGQLAKASSSIIKALVHMEYHGIRVDKAKCAELTSAASARIAFIERGFKDLNLASPKQLGAYLYENLKFPVQGKTATGTPSTNEDTLEALQVWATSTPGKKKHLTVIQLIREHRKLVKQVSTYYRPIAEKMDANGYLHPSYNITGTVTGRLSCNDPNLMNIPRSKTADVKQVFIADPGCVLVQADYSQIELRLGAMLAEETTMLDAFARGEDLHTKTAQLILRRDPTPEERTHAKSVNFGIFYGIGPHKLSLETGLPIQEAKRFISEWFLAYPKVKAWLRAQESTVLDLGYVTSIFGRKRRLPLVVASRADQMRVVRQACNFPVQSAAGELTLLAMAALQEDLPDGATIIANVHDSLLVNCRKEDQKKVVTMVRNCMENATGLVRRFGWSQKITVPTPVDISVGRRWGDLK